MRWDTILDARASRATILIRVMVGAVFVSEGVQKFLFPDQLGAGRFESIGFAHAQLLGPFVGAFEITCGALVLIGLATRLAVFPLIIIMLTAIAATKLPILLGGAFGPFHAQGLKNSGFWAMAHETRTDWSMLLASAFLCLTGSGRWSIDEHLVHDRPPGPES
jgi:uncharacterized membrane protein YphA (DoxX/SURF4 family)